MRRLLALLALLATAFALVGASPSQAQPTGKKAEKRYEAQAFAATNAQRAKEGLDALEKAECVQHAAVRQAKKMARQKRMFHQDMGKVMRECKLGLVGENVAYGYPSGKSVVNDGWMHSAGHRANILTPGFTQMGIGARKGRDGRWYVAQVFGAPR